MNDTDVGEGGETGKRRVLETLGHPTFVSQKTSGVCNVEMKEGIILAGENLEQYHITEAEEKRILRWKSASVKCYQKREEDESQPKTVCFGD